MIRKMIALLLCLMLLIPAAQAEDFDVELEITEILENLPEEQGSKILKDSDGAVIMTITCTGDFTIGGDTFHNKDIFTPELNAHDGNINFTMSGVRDILTGDDLTIVNFEGTFTDTTYVPSSKQGNEFLFSISPSYVNVLTDNGIEAVSLENNHVMDHGEEGFEDTKKTLRDAGVIYSTSDEKGIFEFEGIQVAMLSYLCIDRYGKPFGGYPTFEEKVAADIAEAKQYYPLVIVSFHWGLEPTSSQPNRGYKPTDNQIRLGRLAVDSGADLVVGHHSHRVQPIECYNGVYICYSLGNFCFAGNKSPKDMTSIMFQIRYRIKDAKVAYKDFRVIPIRISSKQKVNDFIPTPFKPGAESDSIFSTMRSSYNTKGLDYAISEFPMEFD
ncbi:MAG: CapA family protein [Clostridia bacterium]|nr:CapA family protein [Clostridia bacterium]